MKKIGLVVTALAVLGALLCTGCAQERPGEVAWELPIDNFYQQPHPDADEVHVPVGDTFKLILGSNATTGFRWSEEASIDDTSLLNQVSHEYVAPGTDLPGAAGKEIWEFEALKEGEATVYLEYRQPWSSHSEPEWSYTVTVNIK